MNAVLVTVDALRADHLAQYGYDRNTMPVLDDLVDEGAVRFASAFANGTNTGLSLPSLLSSRYLGDAAVRDGPTVATPLRAAGVATAAVHSNTFFATKFDNVAGFGAYEDFGVAGAGTDGGDAPLSKRLARRAFGAVRPAVDRLGVRAAAERVQRRLFPARLVHEVTYYEDAARTTDRAVEWLEGIDGEFFLWVHYMDPHRPYGQDLADPAYGPPADRATVERLMATAGVHPDRVSPDERRRMVDLYDSEVRYANDHLSRLFDALRDRGLWAETNVVVTADHGEEFGEHGQFFHRNRPYDELLHVPLVVRRPGGDGGTVEQPRELLDVAPTVCGFHGVEPPDGFRGRDLFEGGSRRVVATGSFVDEGRVVACRWDGWKYVRVEGGDEELYDLSADPGERRNVAGEEPGVARRYRAAAPAHLFETDAAGVPEDASDAAKERLEGLGYLE